MYYVSLRVTKKEFEIVQHYQKKDKNFEMTFFEKSSLEKGIGSYVLRN